MNKQDFFREICKEINFYQRWVWNQLDLDDYLVEMIEASFAYYQELLQKWILISSQVLVSSLSSPAQPNLYFLFIAPYLIKAR